MGRGACTDMCTVTVISLEARGLRLVTNRDESRTRPPATPPRLVRLASGRVAVWPIDAQAGGTWVALSDLGLVLALLNSNPHPGETPTPGARSRGLIIPGLIAARGAEEAMAALSAQDLRDFAPFRLVAADTGRISDAQWDGARLSRAAGTLSPRCFASSGLGDAIVRPRLALFESWIADHGEGPDSQDEFHCYRWPGRGEISVLMERPDARTVSVTTVEWTAGLGGSMRYSDDAGIVTVRLNAPSPHPVGSGTGP